MSVRYVKQTYIIPRLITCVYLSGYLWFQKQLELSLNVTNSPHLCFVTGNKVIYLDKNFYKRDITLELWDNTSGITPLGGHLWDNTSGRTPLGGNLWDNTSGRTPLGGHLWDNTSGRTPLG